MIANNAFMIQEMKEKVRKETEQEFRKQYKIQIVKNAIKLGMSDDDISKLTELKVEEVTKIRMGKYDC